MANIADFLAKMAQGGARPNQFRVNLTFPAFVSSALRNNAERAGEFLCRAATLPASNIQDIVIGFRGRPVHFAGERDFAPWNVSILNDNDFLIRDAMEEWSAGIVKYESTEGRLAPREYLVEMSVEQLERNSRAEGGSLKKYTFHDAYPVSVGDIQLGFDQNNTIEEFGVQFVYNYFTTERANPTRP